MKTDPTKDSQEEEKPSEPQGKPGDMVAAYATLFPPEDKEADAGKKATTKEPNGDEDDDEDDEDDEGDGADKSKESKKPESEPDKKDELDLKPPKDGEDIAAWIEQKEKGVQKVVERAKKAEESAKAKELEYETMSKDVAEYKENRDVIAQAVSFVRFIGSSPENFEKGVAAFRAKTFKEEFKPEHESEQKLATHLEQKMAAEIASLKAEIQAFAEPIKKDQDARAQKAALDKRAEDEYEEAALEVAAVCKGYQVSKDDYRKAIEAYPSKTGVGAVREYCFDGIMAHASEASVRSQPKKKEITASTGAKPPVPPKSSNLVDHYEYLKQTGAVTG